MSSLVEVIFHVLFSFFWWLVLLPILWLVASPFILILAIFSKYPYWQSVGGMYSGVTDTWKEWGALILP